MLQTRATISARMVPYPNLVSDSTLVQDTIDLLTDAGGRAAASEIVDAVFKLSHIDDDLAGLLVADLIRNDRRFKIIDNNTVELQQDDWDTRLLRDLDFVVVDVEATGAKTPPNRLIELGAYRIRGGKIVDKFLRKEIFIEGALAQSFKEGVEALIESEPSEEEIDEYLGRFSSLMHQPVVLH